MKDLAIFSCEAHGSTLIVAHGEVMYIESDGAFNFYSEEDKIKSLWLEVVAGRFKASTGWQRIL